MGTEKVPDAKVVGKIAQVIGPEVVAELHRRIVELARENKVVSRAQDAGGHHGGGNQHPLSDRQQLARGWHAGVDAVDEAGRRAGGRTGQGRTRPDAEHSQEGGSDRDQQPAEGAARRGTATQVVWGVVELGRESGAASGPGDEGNWRAGTAQAAANQDGGRADRDDVGASATGDPANQGARARWRHKGSRQDRERVRDRTRRSSARARRANLPSSARW